MLQKRAVVIMDVLEGSHDEVGSPQDSPEARPPAQKSLVLAGHSPLLRQEADLPGEANFAVFVKRLVLAELSESFRARLLVLETPAGLLMLLYLKLRRVQACHEALLESPRQALVVHWVMKNAHRVQPWLMRLWSL